MITFVLSPTKIDNCSFQIFFSPLQIHQASFHCISNLLLLVGSITKLFLPLQIFCLRFSIVKFLVTWPTWLFMTQTLLSPLDAPTFKRTDNLFLLPKLSFSPVHSFFKILNRKQFDQKAG